MNAAIRVCASARVSSTNRTGSPRAAPIASACCRGVTAADPELTPADRLRGLLTTMFAVKWAKAREDPELFATFRVLAAEHSAAPSAHVAFLLAQIRGIVVDGVACGDFAACEPAVIARAVFNATSRFHDPTHAAEWQSPEAEAESAAVISLILDGIRAR
jgi:hypothetical protein